MITRSIGKAFDEGVLHRFALDTMDDAYRMIADGTARGKLAIDIEQGAYS